MQGERINFLWLNLAEDHLVGNESFSNYLSHWMFWREEKIRVIAEDIWLPSDLDSEVSEWLVKESDMKSSVNFVF